MRMTYLVVKRATVIGSLNHSNRSINNRMLKEVEKTQMMELLKWSYLRIVKVKIVMNNKISIVRNKSYQKKMNMKIQIIQSN